MGQVFELISHVDHRIFHRCRGFKFIPTTIGEFTTIGANSIIEAAAIGSYVEVGKNCVIGKHAVIKDCCLIEDGTILPADSVVPPFSRVAGVPGKIVGELPENYMAMRKEASEVAYELLIKDSR